MTTISHGIVKIDYSVYWLLSSMYISFASNEKMSYLIRNLECYSTSLRNSIKEESDPIQAQDSDAEKMFVVLSMADYILYLWYKLIYLNSNKSIIVNNLRMRILFGILTNQDRGNRAHGHSRGRSTNGNKNHKVQC